MHLVALPTLYSPGGHPGFGRWSWSRRRPATDGLAPGGLGEEGKGAPPTPLQMHVLLAFTKPETITARPWGSIAPVSQRHSRITVFKGHDAVLVTLWPNSVIGTGSPLTGETCKTVQSVRLAGPDWATVFLMTKQPLGAGEGFTPSLWNMFLAS